MFLSLKGQYVVSVLVMIFFFLCNFFAELKMSYLQVSVFISIEFAYIFFR